MLLALPANATEEFFVRRSPLYEASLTFLLSGFSMIDRSVQVVGMLGMWGTIVNGIQASSLEHNTWMTSNWDGGVSM